MGVEVPASTAVAGAEVVEVWPVNAASVDAFLTMSLGWRGMMGFGPVVWTGIDLAGLDALIRRRGLGDREFEDVIVMVETALPILNERD